MSDNCKDTGSRVESGTETDAYKDIGVRVESGTETEDHSFISSDYIGQARTDLITLVDIEKQEFNMKTTLVISPAGPEVKNQD